MLNMIGLLPSITRDESPPSEYLTPPALIFSLLRYRASRYAVISGSAGFRTMLASLRQWREEVRNTGRLSRRAIWFLRLALIGAFVAPDIVQMVCTLALYLLAYFMARSTAIYLALLLAALLPVHLVVAFTNHFTLLAPSVVVALHASSVLMLNAVVNTLLPYWSNSGHVQHLHTLLQKPRLRTAAGIASLFFATLDTLRGLVVIPYLAVVVYLLYVIWLQNLRHILATVAYGGFVLSLFFVLIPWAHSVRVSLVTPHLYSAALLYGLIMVYISLCERFQWQVRLDVFYGVVTTLTFLGLVSVSRG